MDISAGGASSLTRVLSGGSDESDQALGAHSRIS